MTWLRGPPLLVACSDNKIADVKKLLALGADPQAAAPSYDERSPTRPSHSSCIFSCIHKGYFEVLEALLATGQYELVHQVQNVIPRGAPPLMYLLWHKAKRVNELVCECGGDLEEVARTDEETKELVREWISKISSYNGGAHLGTDSYFD